jgi:hypothetical protein
MVIFRGLERFYILGFWAIWSREIEAFRSISPAFRSAELPAIGAGSEAFLVFMELKKGARRFQRLRRFIAKSFESA